jgi:hypothetical protein
MTMTTRPLIQDLVKTAMANGTNRAQIAAEGARQLHGAPATKTASANPQSITTDFAMKLASAIEYATPALVKAASDTGPGVGPGALTVTETTNSDKPIQPNSQGKGTQQSPMTPPMESPTKLQTTINDPPGGSAPQQTAMSGGKGKTASAELAQRNLDALSKLAGAPAAAPVVEEKKASAPTTLLDYFAAVKTKVAEDAINPAHISAGAAVPPDTSASGESGGAPVAGMPQGNTGLVASNESAANYKRDQAYAGRKGELAQYFNEPALSSAHDTTLQQAFAHTGEAGTKLSSALGETVKTAAARALLMKLSGQGS